jgi:post-segregation antitoxin (ccd killing protein)
MPKLSVYVPDELYDAVRRHDIAVSAVAQAALEAAVATKANRAWVARAQDRPLRRSGIDTSSLIADVREEFGT